MMPDRDEDGLPEKTAPVDEIVASDTPKITVAKRRKSVGVNRAAHPDSLKALEYLGRRWLSRR